MRDNSPLLWLIKPSELDSQLSLARLALRISEACDLFSYITTQYNFGGHFISITGEMLRLKFTPNIVFFRETLGVAICSNGLSS